MAEKLDGLAVASLALIIVLLVCYMCVQLFKSRTPAAPCDPPQPGTQEGFGTVPSFCSWGLTTGKMPSIENNPFLSWAPCCSGLGVPPPGTQ